MVMFLAPLPMVYIFLSSFVLQERVLMLMTSTTDRNLFLTAKLLKQGYRNHKIRKAFSKFRVNCKYNLVIKTAYSLC